jgi:mannosyltransferase OCH1-like enzyme
MKIPKIIHQVYGIFKDEKTLDDIPIFKKHTELTKAFCKGHNIQYKMWSLKDCEELLCEYYPEYIELWNEFRYPIQRADFIRYLILHRCGGIYIDCDIYPVKPLDTLLNDDLLFVCWHNDTKKLPYNAIMGAIPNHNLFIQICKDIIKRVEEKQSMKIYDTWKGRLVFQTTGHSMLKNHIHKQYIKDVLHIQNDTKNINVIGNEPYFYDSNISSWY